MGYSVGEGENSILFWALLLFNCSAFSTFVAPKTESFPWGFEIWGGKAQYWELLVADTKILQD